MEGFLVPSWHIFVGMHCAHLKRGPKIFKKGTKRGPDFEQKGDLKGTKRGPKRGPKNRGFKISKKAYMLKFSTKKSNLPSKFIERVHFHIQNHTLGIKSFVIGPNVP